MIPKSFGKRVSKKKSILKNSLEFNEEISNLNIKKNNFKNYFEKFNLEKDKNFKGIDNMNQIKQQISKWKIENQNCFQTPSMKIPQNLEDLEIGKYFTLNPKFFNFKN